MIDCKLTENYFKEKQRMCENSKCKDCLMRRLNSDKNVFCEQFEKHNIKAAINIVQKWSNKHPQKTLLTEFLEHYPKTELNGMGIPNIAPCELGLVDLNSKCIENCVHQYSIGLPCKDCWNTPVVEESEE